MIQTIEEDSLRKIPVIICGNKTDLKEAARARGRTVVDSEDGERLVITTHKRVTIFVIGHSTTRSLLLNHGHATLHPAVSVGLSGTFLNGERFLNYCSCPTFRVWVAVYTALLHVASVLS